MSDRVRSLSTTRIDTNSISMHSRGQSPFSIPTSCSSASRRRNVSSEKYRSIHCKCQALNQIDLQDRTLPRNLRESNERDRGRENLICIPRRRRRRRVHRRQCRLAPIQLNQMLDVKDHHLAQGYLYIDIKLKFQEATYFHTTHSGLPSLHQNPSLRQAADVGSKGDLCSRSSAKQTHVIL
jgi:hypothetical protein